MTNDAITTAALPLAPGHWTMDPLHSSVHFTIRHLGISTVRGRFSTFGAELYVGATADDVRVSATIELASVDTGSPERDAHLRAADRLDVARRPTMTYRSTRVRGGGAEWTVDGELTIGDVTRPVSLAVDFGGLGDSPVGSARHAGFGARGRIRRSDFGLDFAPGVLGDVVGIQLDLQFVQPADG
ncbi:YceI family protein [Streptomyces griseosporeus]|uniref:YceI family protein n=1 Tax=Streptomyces griseosporeus TaxID=1910 RepID=UPI00379714BA